MQKTMSLSTSYFFPVLHPAFSKLLTTLLLFLIASTVWAAKAPLSPEKLEEEAVEIITATVLEVTSTIEESKFTDKSPANQDQVFKIKLKVQSILKGSGVKKDQELEIVAWKPHARSLFAAIGLQGHETIPKKGDAVTVYLEAKQGEVFMPIIPNGIVISKNMRE